MKTILLFSGSNSSTSLNQQLIRFTSTLVEESVAKVIDLRDYAPPIFSVDLEKEVGTHPKIDALVKEIEQADGLIVSTPEHNGMPPAFFKNILDWLSRVKKMRGNDGKQYLENKPVLLMSAGPGKGGALKARELVKKVMGYGKANFIGEFSLPEFHQNFENGKLVNKALHEQLSLLVQQLEREV